MPIRTCSPRVRGVVVGATRHGIGRARRVPWEVPGEGAAPPPQPGRRAVVSGLPPGASGNGVRPGTSPGSAVLHRVVPAPVGARCRPAACVRYPALTGYRGAGIVVSCAQGALGLLPFAVRLGGLLAAG